MKKIALLILSSALMLGCATGDFQTSSSSSDASSSATDSSTSDSFNETQQQINSQMAVDAANAAAQQQFNDSMAATQLFENQHNDDFNANGLH